MLSLIGLCLVPVVVGGVAFALSKRDEGWKRITLREFAVLEVICVGLAVAGFMYARHQALQDTEHWNGRVLAKHDGTHDCCHCRDECDTCTDDDGSSYECNCVEICDHSYDYYWSLAISTGDEVVIRDCAGSPRDVPEIWIKAKINEPASVAHTYTNYLKADPESLFVTEPPEAYARDVPAFPVIHDHYKVNKVVRHRKIPVDPGWERGLRELNADLGPRVQVDVTLVVTPIADPAWADAVESVWLYGPKNALVIVVGAPDKETIAWARVVTISRVSALKVALRDGLVGASLKEPAPLVAMIRREVTAKFKRTPMAEFEYLMSALELPWFWILGLYLASALSTAVLAWLFYDQVDA